MRRILYLIDEGFKIEFVFLLPKFEADEGESWKYDGVRIYRVDYLNPATGQRCAEFVTSDEEVLDFLAFLMRLGMRRIM